MRAIVRPGQHYVQVLLALLAMLFLVVLFCATLTDFVAEASAPAQVTRRVCGPRSASSDCPGPGPHYPFDCRPLPRRRSGW
jgi:hypothetical protein